MLATQASFLVPGAALPNTGRSREPGSKHPGTIVLLGITQEIQVPDRRYLPLQSSNFLYVSVIGLSVVDCTVGAGAGIGGSVCNQQALLTQDCYFLSVLTLMLGNIPLSPGSASPHHGLLILPSMLGPGLGGSLSLEVGGAGTTRHCCQCALER